MLGEAAGQRQLHGGAKRRAATTDMPPALSPSSPPLFAKCTEHGAARYCMRMHGRTWLATSVSTTCLRTQASVQKAKLQTTVCSACRVGQYVLSPKPQPCACSCKL